MLGEDNDAQWFEIWPDNAGVLEIFLQLRTQWRAGPMGGCLGLDYHGVESVLRMRRVKDRAAMLDDLQVMEAAALQVHNRKAGE